MVNHIPPGRSKMRLIQSQDKNCTRATSLRLRLPTFFLACELMKAIPAFPARQIDLISYWTGKDIKKRRVLVLPIRAVSYDFSC